MFGARFTAGLAKGDGDNSFDENKQYSGMLGMAQEAANQAKLNKAKQSVNYGRKPGESGRTFEQEKMMQESIKKEQAKYNKMVSNQGDLSSSQIGFGSSFSPSALFMSEKIYGSNEERQRSMPERTPLSKLDSMYNGKPGVQKEDFEQF